MHSRRISMALLTAGLTVTVASAPLGPAGAATTRRMFTGKHSLRAPVTDETFTPKVPSDYQRIKILRHATVIDPKLDAPAPAETPAPGTKTK